MNTNFNNIFIYTRVSTIKQSNKTISLINQYDTCKNYISSNYFYKNIYHFQDIASSYKNKNALRRQKIMVKSISKNDLIIIYDISRLGRNIYQVIDFLEKIKNKGAMIYSVEDKLFYGKDKLLDNLFLHKVIKAKEFSDFLSNRTKNSQAFIKENGGHIGKIPYGYKLSYIDGLPKLIINDDEEKIIKLIINKHDKECLSFNEITKFLNNNLIKKRDSYWTFANVRYIYCKNINRILLDNSIGIKRTINNTIINPINKKLSALRSLIIN